MKAEPTPAMRPLSRIQRKCACGSKPRHADECDSCKRKKLQRRALSGVQDSLHEREADDAAARVLAGQAPPRITPVTQGPDTGERLPSSVERALAEPGEPLDVGTRTAMERGFGADFSSVRIHRSATAHQSARDIDARAYAAGSHIVFGEGQYAPAGAEGRALLAHELTHTLQQGGPRDAPVQRACLPAKDCAGPKATLEEFVQATESKPENISKADKRRKACTKTPRDPRCTSDGHGAKASALTEVVKKHYASRLGHVSGIHVDKDIPSDYGAVTYGCADFMPPLAGGTCTFVPARLEAQAKQFRAAKAKVGGVPRSEWLTATLGTITHETEHARYDAQAAIPEPGPSACKFADHQSNLSEMASHLSEMHVYYRDALTRPAVGRFKTFYQMFDYWVKNGAEDISGIVKHLRCECECADADHYIVKTSESVSSHQKWDSVELTMIHTELADPKWGLAWPVKPPASISLTDLPNVAPVPLKLE
jgi:hypothetical protein